MGSWLQANASIVFWQPRENNDRPSAWELPSPFALPLLCLPITISISRFQTFGIPGLLPALTLGSPPFLIFPTSKTEPVLPSSPEPSETCSRKVLLKCTYDDNGLFIIPAGSCSSAWYILLLKSYSWYSVWIFSFPNSIPLLIVISLPWFPFPREKKRVAFLRSDILWLVFIPNKPFLNTTAEHLQWLWKW